MTQWPFAGDTKLDRSRRVARAYRDALVRVDAHTCGLLDTAAVAVGETWIVPQHRPPLPAQEWVPAIRVADALGIEEQRVRKWGQRGQVPRLIDADGRPLFRLADCQARLAALRRARRGHDA